MFTATPLASQWRNCGVSNHESLQSVLFLQANTTLFVSWISDDSRKFKENKIIPVAVLIKLQGGEAIFLYFLTSPLLYYRYQIKTKVFSWSSHKRHVTLIFR